MLGRTGRQLGAGLIAVIVALAGFGGLLAQADSLTYSQPAPLSGGVTVTGELADLVDVNQFTTSLYSAYVIDGRGQLWAWGHNTWGQLGDGSTTNQSTPVRAALPPGIDIDQFFAGQTSAYLLDSTGVLWAWGWNQSGQLGDGTTTQRETAVPVDLTALEPAAKLELFAAGNYSAYLFDSTGVLWAWGSNSNGQLGDGTTTQRETAVAVDLSALSAGVTIEQIAAGTFSTYILDSDGRVWAWGQNSQGQLGDGTNTERHSPVEVHLPAGVKIVQLVAGGYSGYGLADDGVLWAWGQNTQGQLGDGTTIQRTTPVSVNLPAGLTVQQIATGANSVYVLDSTGQVWAWGNNNQGQLGDGTSNDSSTPQAVTVLSLPPTVTVDRIAAGGWSGYVLDSSGQIWGWGGNSYGQLGDGTTDASLIPIPVSFPIEVVMVIFDGVGLADDLVNENGQWSVTAPGPHCGPVDVVVNYIIDGERLSKVYTNGFEYGQAPSVITQPVGPAAAIASGSGFSTTTLAVDGIDYPSIQWQSSADGADPWIDISGATGATLTVTSLTEETHFRAIITNCWSALAPASQPEMYTEYSDTITVLILADIDPHDGGTDGTKVHGGGMTANSNLWWLMAAAAGLAALGLVTVVAIRRRLASST